MTTIYTNVVQKYNKIFFRGKKDGKRIQSKLNYSPTLYVKNSSCPNPDALSLYKHPLQKRVFSSIGEAKEFMKENQDVLEIHGNNKYEYAFIHDNFPETQKVSLSELKTEVIDIETTVESGLSIQEFLQDPLEEILLISIVDMQTKSLVTFGSRPVDDTVKNYILCKDEKDLLQKYINHTETSDPDIITGWNSNGFDISYLCSRIIRILGQEWCNRLSPFGIVERNVDSFNGRTTITYDICGRSTLDLLELYKKFRLINRESYRLDFIGEIELGEKKLKNPYSTFKDFYSNDWNLFCRYNQRDVDLVLKLEEKLGLIYLAVSMAYKSKINFADVYSPVKVWEQFIHLSLKAENKFCPIKNISRGGDSIVGGHVKEPIKGLYKWVVTFDFTSLYPIIMQALNMSPECFVDMTPCSVAEVLGGYKNNTPYAMAANGSLYTKDELGIVTRLVEQVFNERKAAKDKMKEAKKKFEKTKDIVFKQEADLLHVMQNTAKTLINSLYGSIGCPYFMFFDNRIAEGVTMTGQAVIQHVSRDINEYLNKVVGTTGVDYVITMDTDSGFFNFGPFVDKFFPGKSDGETVDLLNKVITLKIRGVIDKSLAVFVSNLNAFPGKLDFKLEKFASSGFFTGKKRYALRVIENEGIRYATPETAITGIEVVRSSTPQVARNWLKEAIEIILDGDKEKFKKYVSDTEGRFASETLEAVAFPRSANNIEEYSDKISMFKKGCPIGVRASILYNKYLEEKKLSGKYQPIGEGDKIKFIYLKKPNIIQQDVIGFVSELPPEFGLHKYVDYPTQFEKVFLAPLEKITEAISWDLKEKSSLEDFF